MLARHRRRPRARGFTLVELVLAMSLTGAVLALTVSVATRLQRQFGAAAARAAAAERLGDGAAMLAIALRPLAPASDVNPAQSSDSTLELRATIATGVACGRDGTALLAAVGGAGGARIEPGDSVDVLADGDSAESWTTRAMLAIHRVPGRCAAFAAGADADRLHNASVVWALALDGTFSADSQMLIGAAVRIRRPQRFALYRAGDGLHYLGVREWLAASRQFAAVQPVSGPYVRAPGGASRFQFFDAGGRALDPGAGPVAAARVEILLVSAASGTARDSQLVVVAPRGSR